MAAAAVGFDINSLDTPSAFISPQQRGVMETDFALSPDSAYMPGYSPVVPDMSFLNLPGQLPGIPGGAASNGGYHTSDSSGINAIYTDPAVNPTPSGGYMQALAQIAAAASQSFTTFVKGSPSVAIPPSKVPTSYGSLGGALSLTTPQGTTNWTTIGIIALVGVIGIVLVVKLA